MLGSLQTTSQNSSGKGSSFVFVEMGFGTITMEQLSFAKSLDTRLVLSDYPLDKALQPSNRSVLVHVPQVTQICQPAREDTIHTQLGSTVSAPQGRRMR